MSTAMQIGEELHKLRTEQAALFAKTRKDDGSYDMSAEQVGEANKRNDDITAKAKLYEDTLKIEGMADTNDEALKSLESGKGDSDAQKALRRAADGKPADVVPVTLGRVFTKSVAYTGWKQGMNQGPVAEIDLDKEFAHIGGSKAVFSLGMKTTFTQTSFPLPQIRLDLPPIQPGEQQPTVADLFPQGRTATQTIRYMEETTTTQAASETDEQGSKPEAALAFTERSSEVRKIAVSLPITDEALDDTPFIESYIDERLRAFVRYREDSQFLVGSGSGTPTQLRGILNVSGILTQAKGTDPTPDAVYKAMVLIRTNSYLQPTGAVFHPLDWQDVRLLRTADGIYIWGNPSEAGPERIWGLNVVQTTALTQNTGLVGAFSEGAMVFRRADLSMSIGFVNDQFVKNMRTILVEERVALVVFRPKAFCTVTGI